MLLGFSPAEIAVVLIVVLLIFGPSKLPQLGSSVGKMLRGFKKEMKEINADDEEEAKKSPAGEIDVTPHKSGEKPRPG
jgi:sec-independent protein translocase protein TatA